MEKTMTTDQLADHLGVHPMTIRRKAKAGKIPFIAINKRGERRFYLSEVLKALESNKKDYYTEHYWTKHLGERGKHVHKHDNPYNEESQRAEDRIMGIEENPYN